MKKYFVSMLAALVAMSISLGAMADAAYPVTNPTYIPTASSPPATYSAPFDYNFQSNGLETVSVRISGTCTSLAATIQGSNDNGANWTNLNAAGLPSGSSTVAISTTGFWRVNSSGLNKLRVHGTALTASCTVAMAGTQAGMSHADPCNNPNIKPSSVVLNQGASATTKVVEAVTGSSIHVCGFVATAAGTNPTVTFKYGTKVSTDCDTGAVSLSGAMTPSATVGVINYSNGSTSMTAPASNQLCMTTAATTSIQGVLNYVQQ